MSRIDKFTAKLGGHIRESMGAAPTTTGAGGPLPTPSAGPSQYQGVTRPKEALTIPIGRIMADPDQPRKEFDEGSLDDLCSSLKARGQLQPIRVRWSQEADRWIIIAGERRYRAAVKAGLPSLLCVEAKGAMTVDEILEDQLIENCVREDLKPIEQARAFKALVDRRGCSYRQLAEILNISHMAVSRAISLLELPDDVQDRVTAGELAASVAVEVARLDDPEEQREVAERVISGGLNRSEAIEVVRQAESKPRPGGSKAKGRGASKGGPRLPTERTLKTAGGLKVTVAGRKGFDLPAWLEAMEDAARQVRAKLESVEDHAAA
jgi:ParB family transcriptional regulator, chromosome partitioning protein